MSLRHRLLKPCFASERLEDRRLFAISGTVFQDPTGDGFSQDDTPQSGVTVQLFLDNGDQQFNPASDIAFGSQVTGSDGTYTFQQSPGLYFVRQIVPSNFTQSDGPSFYTVDATQQLQFTGLDFANTSDVAADPAVQLLASIDGVEANVDGSGSVPLASPGDTATFRYVLTNTGNVALLPHLVDDNGTDDTADDFNVMASPGVVLVESGVANGVLDVGETWTATLGRVLTSPGLYQSKAHVTATPTGGGSAAVDEDAAAVFLVQPGLTIETRVNNRDANSEPPAFEEVQIGSVADYTYLVSNTGNVILAINSLLDDNALQGASFTPSPRLSGQFNIGDVDADNLFDPGETWEFEKLAVLLSTVGLRTNIASVFASLVDSFGEPLEGFDELSDSDPANIQVNDSEPEEQEFPRIDNDLPSSQVGHFEFQPGPGGQVGSSGESGSSSGVTARGLTQLFENADFIFDFLNYVSTGGEGGMIDLGATTITQQPTLIADDTVQSRGTFQGPNGLVQWTVVSKFDDSARVLQNIVSFASESPLGDLQFVNYLDEDVEGPSDDFLLVRGNPGDANFQLFTLDDAERVGFSHQGVYESGSQLQNATWDGWAADRFSLLRSNIRNGTVTYSRQGNIVTDNLPPFTDPELGNVFGLADVTTAFSYTVDPLATSSTITTFLRLIEEDPPPATPTLTITQLSQTEGNSGETRFVFEVKLSSSSDQAVNVSYRTVEASATTEDFFPTSGAISFHPGETSKTIVVLVKGDTTIEEDEAFAIELLGASNATVANSQTVATIQNDDLDFVEPIDPDPVEPVVPTIDPVIFPPTVATLPITFVEPVRDRLFASRFESDGSGGDRPAASFERHMAFRQLRRNLIEPVRDLAILTYLGDSDQLLLLGVEPGDEAPAPEKVAAVIRPVVAKAEKAFALKPVVDELPSSFSAWWLLTVPPVAGVTWLGWRQWRKRSNHRRRRIHSEFVTRL